MFNSCKDLLKWRVRLRKTAVFILQRIAQYVGFDADKEIVNFILSVRDPVEIYGEASLIT